MPTAVTRAQRVAFRSACRLGGAAYTYTRGGLSCELRHLLVSRPAGLAMEAGVVTVNTTDLDVEFYAADLLLGGVIVEPQSGDRLLVVLAEVNRAEIYEVRPPKGEQAWQWSSVPGEKMRVHLKLVGES